MYLRSVSLKKIYNNEHEYEKRKTKNICEKQKNRRQWIIKLRFVPRLLRPTSNIGIIIKEKNISFSIRVFILMENKYSPKEPNNISERIVYWHTLN